MKMNMNSDCIYIAKRLYNDRMNITIVHAVDEDCNEFICILFGYFGAARYMTTETFENAAIMEYSAPDWERFEEGARDANEYGNEWIIPKRKEQ